MIETVVILFIIFVVISIIIHVIIIRERIDDLERVIDRITIDDKDERVARRIVNK